MKSPRPSHLVSLTSSAWKNRSVASAMVFSAAVLASPAGATIAAWDDFSSLTTSGGSGWSSGWSEVSSFNDGSTSAFPDPESAAYAVDLHSSIRPLSTPLQASTTPEVWAAIYIRPVTNTGWQFGFEVGSNLSISNNAGAQIGRMHGDGRYAAGRTNAENVTFTSNSFVANRPTLLVIRLYKNNPSDTVYNRADYYADLDGADGRSNNLVTLATGKDLLNRSPASVTQIRLLSDGQVANFDYVAVATTLAEVLDPTPSSRLYWDGDNTTANADGGTGTWDNSSTNWSSEPVAGAPSVWTTNTEAIFDAAPGIITLGEPVLAKALNFKVSGYEITGDALTLEEEDAYLFTAGDTLISSALADINSAGALKSGSGKLTFTGDGSGFTGTLVVDNGRLDLVGHLAGSVLIGDLASFGGEGTLGHLTLGQETGATFFVDPSTTEALTTGDLTVLKPVSVRWNDAPPEAPASFTLLHYTGTFTGNAASFQFHEAGGGHFTAIDTGSSIDVSLTPSESITFTNAATYGQWFSGPGLPSDLHYGEANWNSSDGFFFNGDHVTFDDSAGGSFDGFLSILGTVRPASITFDHSEINYTLTGGSIGGTAALVKNGSGTLLLNNPNSFSGGVEINGGTLAVDGSQFMNRLPAGTSVVVNQGGTFQFRHTNPVPTLDFIVNEGGLVTSTGASNNHNHFGNVTLNGGTIATTTTIGSYNGENYQLNGSVTVGGSSLSTIGAYHGISLKGAIPFHVEDSVAGSGVDLLVTSELEAPDSGASSLVKSGAGTMLLSPTVLGQSASNTYVNGTIINEGTILIQTPQSIPALGTGTSVAANAGFGFVASNFSASQIQTIISNVQWNAGGESYLELHTGGGDVVVDANLVGNYKVRATGGGTLTLTGHTPATIETDGITAVFHGTAAATVISDVVISTAPDGSNPALTDVSISFSADGTVDVYASDDLLHWGSPILTAVEPSAPILLQDQASPARFFILVSSGQAYPPAP